MEIYTEIMVVQKPDKANNSIKTALYIYIYIYIYIIYTLTIFFEYKFSLLVLILVLASSTIFSSFTCLNFSMRLYT